MTTDRDPPDYVTAVDLGLTVEEVRRRWPHATEYVGLDGEPCWARTEIEEGPIP